MRKNSKLREQEEKRQLLENELEDSAVEINGTGFFASHRGSEFELIVNII